MWCILCLFCVSLFSYLTLPAPTQIYPLSLHDALPISLTSSRSASGTDPTTFPVAGSVTSKRRPAAASRHAPPISSCSAGRSEEHTSELQSRPHLVCRLLLEKKKKNARADIYT